MDKKHLRKSIAPIIVAILFLLYIVVIFACSIWGSHEQLIVALMIGIPLLLIGGVVIFVTIQRLNEIRSGEEDDLSKY